MLFSDDFLVDLKNDPVSKLLEALVVTFSALEDNQSWSLREYEYLMETYALILEVGESNILRIDIEAPTIPVEISNACAVIVAYMRDVEKILNIENTKLKIESLRGRFRTTLGNGFAYEFSQGDLDKVQSLLNELRSQISSAHQLDKEHQQRLLRRLEKLQAELHKKVSDLDRFWGLIGDAGVVLGKLGNDAKPIVDRVREIADIVWQTQSRAEELPSGTQLPMLDNKPSANDFPAS